MKRLLSILLTLVIILLSCPICPLAKANSNNGGIDISIYTQSELDLSQFSIEDICNMNSTEYWTLVKEFERVYDPFDSYTEDSNINTEVLEFENIENQISPQWTSGDGSLDEAETGTHEVLTLTACEMLTNVQGFFANEPIAVIAIMLSLSLASILPDKDETSGIFAGHFYNPQTGENFSGSTTNTAKTNAQAHYNTAIRAVANNEMDEAYKYLGRCLHYIQDINVPHHAANVISTGLLSAHYQFEKYAFDNLDTILETFTTSYCFSYTEVLSKSIGDIVHRAAIQADSRIDEVNHISNKSYWAINANYAIEQSVYYSAQVMYKFAMESGLILYT